ncbi:hypothetical protein J6590_023684 [Homalodisca vitripennis]|nr:hypothetical protein J6590_023684 [Homalodisca vitripennis]
MKVLDHECAMTLRRVHVVTTVLVPRMTRHRSAGSPAWQRSECAAVAATSRDLLAGHDLPDIHHVSRAQIPYFANPGFPTPRPVRCRK